MVDPQSIQTYVNEARPQFENMLAQMVEVPSISMDPTRVGDMRRMADLAVHCLAELGAEAGFAGFFGTGLLAIHHTPDQSEQVKARQIRRFLAGN